MSDEIWILKKICRSVEHLYSRAFTPTHQLTHTHTHTHQLTPGLGVTTGVFYSIPYIQTVSQ